MILDALVVCTAVAVGLLGGWWLRGTDPRSIRPRESPDEDGRTREALQRLRDLAHNVAADVDKHKDLMQQINAELHTLEKEDPAVVVQAVSKLIESNEQMQRQLDTAEQKLQFQAREIEDHAAAARTDPLTELANRRAFDDTMVSAHRALVDQHWPTTVMLLDIDHFKRLNDTYGHQAGDAVLRGVSRILRDHVPSGNLIARYGGEEFAVVFANAEYEDVRDIAEQARQAIGNTAFDFEGIELCVTASGGIAQFQLGESSVSLISRADEAMYAAKEAGRDCCYFHEGTRLVPLDRPVVLEQETAEGQQSVERDEFGISTANIFLSDVRRRILDWKEGGAPLCVIFFQIDDLEQVVRLQGADNAHAMRRALALTLKAAMREMDHVGRSEGDAFSLLIPGCMMRGAILAAERLRAAAARCELPKRYALRTFTISVGVAEAMADEDEQQLIERVRRSLLAARSQGRNCTYVHDGFQCQLVGAGQVTVVS